MKVLANRYLYKFREMLANSVQMDLFDPKELPDNAPEYDALFVNTTTPLNEKTLPDPGNISFVATGSSGTDHLDLEYLASKGNHHSRRQRMQRRNRGGVCANGNTCIS